jgi:chromosome segregation ATPase
MRGTPCIIAYLGLTLLLGGCFGASSDPHEGGIFGYSPETYEQRKQEREDQLRGLEDDTRRQKAEAQTLEQERDGKEKKYASLNKQSEALKREVAALSRELKALKVETADQQKLLDSLKRQAAELAGSVQEDHRAGGDAAAEQSRLRELRRRLQQLQQQADGLRSV